MGPVASIPTRTASTLQTAIKRVGLAALVIQSPLREQLAGLFSGHGNLLIACVKITSYNQHCSAPFPEPWSSNSCQVYSVEGADAVIQSVCPIAAGDPRCNNGLRRKNSPPTRGNNFALPGV